MRWLGVVLVAACGAKAPQEPEHVAQPPAAHVTAPDPYAAIRAMSDDERQRIIAKLREDANRSGSSLGGGESLPRPALDLAPYLPDFHTELRWPLKAMTHPTLEPQFAVAAALAVPGIGWHELCARGAQNRTSAANGDLLQYIRGWCRVVARDVDEACKELAPLLHAGRPGLASAVRTDLANILVGTGDAEHAEHWLAKHRIRDSETFDLLAGTYVDLDQGVDAFTINRLALNFADNAATTCHRQARRYLLGDPADKLEAKTALEQLTNANVPDRTCLALLHALMCEEKRECSDYLKDQGLDPRAQGLIDAYDKWPKDRSDWTSWWGVAGMAERAIPTPGAGELATVALETAVAARGTCNANLQIDVIQVADLLRANKIPLDSRLVALLKKCGAPVPTM